MFIAPNTTIKILKNCPLDNTYDHTIYFASKSAQETYFSSLSKHTLLSQSYQRLRNGKGKMRVERKAEDLYDCNYVMFRNASFGNKWFYAFITSVEYVNNITSDIYFEIDVMQTWFFDYTVDACFVEREHSLTDVIGENLVTENIGYGDYILSEQLTSGLFTNWKIVVAKAARVFGVPNVGGFYSRTYSQIEFDEYECDEDGISELAEYLNEMSILSSNDNIADIFMFPSPLMLQKTTAINTAQGNDISINKAQSSLGSYTPRNKKLLCYPYNYMQVDNLQGDSLDIHYEYFNTANCGFHVVPEMTVNPSVVLIPIGYKTDLQETVTIHNVLVISNFPKCAFATSDLGAKLTQGAIGIALASMTGSPAALSGANGTPNITPNYANRSLVPVYDSNVPIIPPNQQGGSTLTTGTQLIGIATVLNTLMRGVNVGVRNPSASSVLYNAGAFDFVFKRFHIRPEFAKILDDFFDRFGYATMRNKVPNTHSRPHWNYVKTQACTITGSIPCDDVSAICNIYNNGITFWKNGSEVGNYSLNNQPT